MNQLKITNPDGTEHLMPLTRQNLDYNIRANSLANDDKRARIAEVDEEGNELKVHHEGSSKLATKNVLSEKDNEIAALKEQLAKISEGSSKLATDESQKEETPPAKGKK